MVAWTDFVARLFFNGRDPSQYFHADQEMIIPPDAGEAQRYIDAYFQRYAGVKAFRERLLQETRQRGFTCTLFGRRRPIPEINARNANQRNFAERTALNSPLQGTAADLIKLIGTKVQADAVKDRKENADTEEKTAAMQNVISSQDAQLQKLRQSVYTRSTTAQ